MGLVLRVQDSGGGATREYFFEVRFPPEVWRHLCLQYNSEFQEVSEAAAILPLVSITFVQL